MQEINFELDLGENIVVATQAAMRASTSIIRWTIRTGTSVAAAAAIVVGPGPIKHDTAAAPTVAVRAAAKQSEQERARLTPAMQAAAKRAALWLVDAPPDADDVSDPDYGF